MSSQAALVFNLSLNFLLGTGRDDDRSLRLNYLFAHGVYVYTVYAYTFARVKLTEDVLYFAEERLHVYNPRAYAAPKA